MTIRINRKEATLFSSKEILGSNKWCLFGIMECWSDMQRYFTKDQQKQIMRAWIALS